MVMEEVFDKLRTLQEILSQKIILEHDIQEIPKLLGTQEELLSRLKKSFIEKNQEFEIVRTSVSEFRRLLAEAEASRERSEKNMDSINTQREYEALDKEIRDASEREQQYRRDLGREERILADLDVQLKSDAALIEQQELELDERRTGIAAELGKKRSEVQTLEEQEKDVVPGMDPEVLFKFERIMRNKMGRGIVAIKGGVCTGCHMILPAQFANNVHTGEEIVFCPYCSRILYFEELDSTEQDYFNDEDAGTFADQDDLDEEEDEFEEEEDEEDEGRSEGGEFDE